MNKIYIIIFIGLLLIFILSYMGYAYYVNPTKTIHSIDNKFDAFFDILLPIHNNPLFFKELDEMSEEYSKLLDFKQLLLKEKILKQNNIEQFVVQASNYIKEKTEYELTEYDKHDLKNILNSISCSRLYYDDCDNGETSSYKSCCEKMSESDV